MSEYNTSKFILVCWKPQSFPSVEKFKPFSAKSDGRQLYSKQPKRRGWDTNSMQETTSCYHTNSSTSQEILRILWQKSSLPPSQQPTICSYPGRYEYSPRPPIQFLKIHLNILLPFAPRFSKCFFTAGFRAKLPLDIRISPLPQQDPLIRLDLSPEYLATHTNHEDPHGTYNYHQSPVTSTYLDPKYQPHHVFSKTLSLFLMWDTKFT